MIKTLLVVASGGAADDLVFPSALTIGRAFAAHLDFLHVRPDAAETAAVMASEGASGALLSGVFDRLSEVSEDRERQAEARFQSFCRAANLTVFEGPPGPAPTVRWRRRLGVDAYWIAADGRAADLIVVGRPERSDGAPLTTIETALLDSGRPVLIPGSSPMSALPETIAIAWKATREAAHAVAAAMPFLTRARTVLLLSVAEAESPDDAETTALLVENLARQGVAASALTLAPGSGSPADALLAAATERQALLVIGGYGHSRLRERVLGGVTRQVLESAPVPVLIAH